jgi:hypothetical protein
MGVEVGVDDGGMAVGEAAWVAGRGVADGSGVKEVGVAAASEGGGEGCSAGDAQP